MFVRKRKDNYPIFYTMLILLVPLLSSKVGSIFAGASFPNNRWVFALIFIIAYITTIVLNKNEKMEIKDLIAIILFYIYWT